MGFKSFANKTRLVFEPGMTAIVGPNGCGKSNVSDAIRWVLGEQRPKALRGSKMQDIIFNGTDSRKPLGMAEVSITFADCEELLKTEFNEVTVTRRVFRTGEGQYFINKTPCRLKDLQRLFMGTGIGTTSYSVMAQGQIDAVLSSRPEDRRAIFEEASGITKFKADKKEAIRKLEHTDANLLRLADVIKEVKRQIGSLQRQAGKARRYKSIQAEMRTLDIFSTRERLGRLEARIRELSGREEELKDQLARLQTEVTALEQRNAERHEELLSTERAIGNEQEKSVAAQAKLNRARDIIRINTQRIEEYQRWSERDSREADQTRQLLEEQSSHLKQLEEKKGAAATELEGATENLTNCKEIFESHQHEIDSARIRLQKQRESATEKEALSSKAQNRLSEIETRERETVIKRERLSVEKSQLSRTVESFGIREADLAKQIAQMQKTVNECDAMLKNLEQRRQAENEQLRGVQDQRAGLYAKAAAKEAQIDTLLDSEQSEEDFPAGSRKLLDSPEELGINPSSIIGPLADHISIEASAAPALEAVLRAWLDAVVISDPSVAQDCINILREKNLGTSRLLAPIASKPKNMLPPKTETLLAAVKVSDSVLPIAKLLLSNVALVDSPKDFPSPIPTGCRYVSRDGALTHADGAFEWWRPESKTSNPLGRRIVVSEAREELARIQLEIGKLTEQREKHSENAITLGEQINATRIERDEHRRSQAQAEGEHNSLERDANTAKKRLETVSWELDEICERSEGSDNEKTTLARQLEQLRSDREELTRTIASQTTELQKLEGRHLQIQSQLTEHRILHAGLNQRNEHLEGEIRSLSIRLGELKNQVEGRTQGIASYADSIKELKTEIEQSQSNLGGLEEQVTKTAAQLDNLRKGRELQRMELSRKEAELAEKRRTFEQQRSRKSSIDIELTEARTHKENRLERVQSEYKLNPEELRAEPDPEWDNATVPTIEEVESRVNELRSRLDSMGPVNLVAIDEYKEFEERYTFLVEQEQDLISAKAQLMEVIRKINKTTSSMFRETFEKAKVNFQNMFSKLFDGGTANLVLINEEDVLECGIDIIARPPGKRLQNVSLLSGGERTLTAVSLLFAIYEIKPSPFCMLDEIDAALDDANIGRFVNTLRDFLKQSQFIIITHNQHTICGSDIVYGVTMPEKGVSRIISMKLPSLLSKEIKPVSEDAEEGTEPPSDEEIARIEAAEAEREEKREKRRQKRAAKKAAEAAKKTSEVKNDSPAAEDPQESGE